MSLPIPSDPNYQVPDLTEEEFNNPKGEEDEALLATGAWDDIPDDTPEDDED